jgi:hypothetical protein
MNYDGGLGVPRDAREAARLIFSAVQKGPLIVEAVKHIGGLLLSPEACEALQHRLRDAGAYDGPIDGACGADVLRAIDTLRERVPARR